MQYDKEKMKQNLRKAIEDPNIKPEFKELAEELLELLDENEELALEIIGLSWLLPASQRNPRLCEWFIIPTIDSDLHLSYGGQSG